MPATKYVVRKGTPNYVDVVIVDKARPLRLKDFGYPLVIGMTPDYDIERDGGDPSVKDAYLEFTDVSEAILKYGPHSREADAIGRILAQGRSLAACYSMTRGVKATLVHGAAVNDNVILFEARYPGRQGNKIKIELKNVGANQSLAIATEDNQETGIRTITVTLATDSDGQVTTTAKQLRDAINAHPVAKTWIKASIPTGGARAQLVTGEELNENAILYRAIQYGESGNKIKIQYYHAQIPGQQLKVDLINQEDGTKLIKVTLAEDGENNIITRAAHIINAINTHDRVNDLVEAMNYGGSDGTGFVSVLPPTALTGGVNPNNNAGNGVVPTLPLTALTGGEDPSAGEISAVLAKLVDDGFDWFYFVGDTGFEFIYGDTEDISDFMSARNFGMYLAGNSPGDLPDDTIFRSGRCASKRTVFYYHSDPIKELVPFAMMGYLGTQFPGSVNWKFKTLEGVADDITLRISEVKRLEEGRLSTGGYGGPVNTYRENEIGHLITTGGKTSAKTYADITHAIDWLTYMIRANIQDLLDTELKVPLTDPGIALVANRIKDVLEYAADRGIVATNLRGKAIYAIYPPRRKNVPIWDLKNRHLSNVRFAALVAGAIDTVEVRGVLTVDEREVRQMALAALRDWGEAALIGEGLDLA